MSERPKDLPGTFAGTRINGKMYDLISVDFEREHPEPVLVYMAKYSPGELVVRTDNEAADFLLGYVSSHLEVCNDGCGDIVAEDFKTY